MLKETNNKTIICLPILLFLFVLASCQSQTKRSENHERVGGPCEGCEAIYEYGGKMLTAVDTLPGFEANEPKLKITGTVYKKDGKTPAGNVLLYIYHTNGEGIYETRGDEKGWAKRHGYIRGWVKTKKDGSYTFYTFRPGAYPNGRAPEHIHVTVKESDKNEYYIDDYLFDDDLLLTKAARGNLRNRGGSGIVKLENSGKVYLVKRDIVLGLNIPNYE